MKLSTIIIDDEIDAIEAIENILEIDNQEITIAAKTNNPVEALGLILKHKPDFIFLDIEMPGMNGFELLESLPEINFEVIFVTAYNEYAIEAIKKNAIDYILKPVTISEVGYAIEKVCKKISQKNNPNDNYIKLIEELKSNQTKKIKIPTANGYEFLCVDDVIRLEASGSYTVAFLSTGEQIVISKSIKEMEIIFEKYDFFRSHRSHLVNLNHIKRFITENDGEIIMSDSSKIPLSRRKKNDFTEALNQIFK